MTRYFVKELSRTRKGKEVTNVIPNIANEVTGRPVANKQIAFLPLAFFFSLAHSDSFVLLFQQVTNFAE